jgi:hypothetical protein
MTRFIWVRDKNEIEYYVNVYHIVRVYGSYVELQNDKIIWLFNEGKGYDTAEDVIAKIQAALA